jgi:hypothetical protein
MSASPTIDDMSPFPSPKVDRRMPEIDPWLLRDPATFLVDLGSLTPLSAVTVIALVHRPSTRQELLATVPIRWAADHEPQPSDAEAEIDRSARSELLHDAAYALWGRRPDRRGRPEHALVTVVVRPGRVVLGPHEWQIQHAWRYANYFLPVHRGDLLLVTEHGWCAALDDSCGAQPAMA